MEPGGMFLILIFAVAAIFVLWLFFHFIPVGLWIMSLAAGVRVSIFQLIKMRFRKIPPNLIVNALINIRKAGLELDTDLLETHYMAGGNVMRVGNALIAASKASIELPWQRATAIDLAGRDVLEAVQTSVNPKVIDCPAQGKVSAVAMDGIQLQAKARVTVRTNIDQLVGGATEDTIIARVGEGIVSAIGSAQTYKDVLENPDKISHKVLDRGLDSGTAYEILSIDIADVDVGRNIGAMLQTDQAAADLKVAQARAETKRAMAVAVEQEMKAKAQAMRAKVIEAEARIPLAISNAFEKGQLGVFDYYNLRNIQADTTMRDSIGESDKTTSGKPPVKPSPDKK